MTTIVISLLHTSPCASVQLCSYAILITDNRSFFNVVLVEWYEVDNFVMVSDYGKPVLV